MYHSFLTIEIERQHKRAKKTGTPKIKKHLISPKPPKIIANHPKSNLSSKIR
jgi:hypothetical protein